jgi:nitrogen fixation protein FixH
MSGESSRPLTGRKVLFIAIAGFGVIIAVNLVLAYKAVTTFSGLVVTNSYVASQDFDSIRDAQDALGWNFEIGQKDGQLFVTLTDDQGVPVWPETVQAVAGRPTTDRDDAPMALVATATGYIADLPAAAGNWLINFSAISADGTAYFKHATIYIRPVE